MKLNVPSGPPALLCSFNCRLIIHLLHDCVEQNRRGKLEDEDESSEEHNTRDSVYRTHILPMLLDPTVLTRAS